MFLQTTDMLKLLLDMLKRFLMLVSLSWCDDDVIIG